MQATCDRHHGPVRARQDGAAKTRRTKPAMCRRPRRYRESDGGMRVARRIAVLIRTVALACFLLVGFIAPTSSWAYRPFIATDAAVADPKEVEIELGYFTLERQNNENAFVIPRVVVNY